MLDGSQLVGVKPSQRYCKLPRVIVRLCMRTRRALCIGSYSGDRAGKCHSGVEYLRYTSKHVPIQATFLEHSACPRAS
jgi:hypothetical protein